MANKRASIDIGSNSTLLLILDIDTKEIIDERSTITSLGKDLDKNKAFLESSMDATFKALEEYKDLCLDQGIQPQEVIMTGTEASRVASNASSFYKKVEESLGLKIKLISGEGEAFYTAKGIAQMANVDSDEVVIMDIGGGSTELILLGLTPFEIKKSYSFPVGSVRTTDWTSENIVDSMFNKAFENQDLVPYSNRNIICVAGTMTSLSLIMQKNKEFSRDLINSFNCSFVDFSKFCEEFQSEKKEELNEKYPFLGKRIHAIQGGAECAKRVLTSISANELSFSTYGLRYGTALAGEIDETYIV